VFGEKTTWAAYFTPVRMYRNTRRKKRNDVGGQGRRGEINFKIEGVGVYVDTL